MFLPPRKDSLEVLKSSQGSPLWEKLEIISYSYIINQELWTEFARLSLFLNTTLVGQRVFGSESLTLRIFAKYKLKAVFPHTIPVIFFEVPTSFLRYQSCESLNMYICRGCLYSTNLQILQIRFYRGFVEEEL